MIVRRIKRKLLRNKNTITGNKIKNKRVNLEWWNKKQNLGDVLSPIVYEWMLRSNQIEIDQATRETKHLLCIGSVIGMGNFDAVVWGSGIHTFKTIKDVVDQRKYRKYDIRAVRGPITASVLKTCGYECPKVYGDPAILMTEIYSPQKVEKKYKISAILHIEHQNIEKPDDIHYINMNTIDYKNVIDEIMLSEKVISSSLHGIILAETYGVPTVFLSEGMEDELLKFYDWYYATGRRNVIIANSMQQAMEMDGMELPDLKEMRESLKNAFPYDLWK